VKLKIAKDIYPLSDFGRVISIVLEVGYGTHNEYLMSLMEISPNDWLVARGDLGKPPLCGTPVRFALAGPTPDLCLHPAPDKEYNLIVRYFPQERTM
jgi:hypothetical protein